MAGQGAEMAAGSGTIHRRGLADQIYDAIEQRILDLEYPPGGKLIIDQIARDLQVSSTPVRDALNRMGADGLVVSTPYVGFSVRPLPKPDEIEKSFVARACIEGFATGLAAPHWEQDELDALERRADAIASGRYSAHAEDFRKFTRANRDFHRTIVELSGNRFLVSAWDTLKHDELVAFTLHERGIPDLGEVVDEHEAILSAIRRRDTAAAEEAARRHIMRGAARILDSMQKLSDGRS